MTPQETVERALALSRTDGCVVLADESSDANLRFANNTVTTNGVTRSRQLTVIALVGKGAGGMAVGSVSRAGVSADGLEDLVRAAEAAARESPPAEDAAELVSPGGDAPAVGGPWDTPPEETSIAAFSDFVPSLRDAFAQAAGNARLLFGFAEHQLKTTYLGSSSGIRLRHDQPMGRLELNAKSPDFARSAWYGQSTFDFGSLHMPSLDAMLGERLGWATRRLDLPAGRYETLLPPTAVADLMIDLYWAAGARDAFEGQTVFSKPGGGTRVGERLSALPITLRSDPAAPGVACSPFVSVYTSTSVGSVFDNGLPLAPTHWIDAGVLAALMQTRHSARLSGLPLTPGIDNLIMEAPGDSRPLREMASDTERGLLLTCLWYIRVVDPQTLLVTGLTRDGVYLVEKGEVVGAVNNFRFNESPVDLLRRATEVGGTELTLSREWSDWFTRTAMPPLRIPDFNMSSVSPAT